LEKLIANQLSSYLEDHRLMHDHQGAYHCEKSSNQIRLFAVDQIVNALDRGHVVCAAFLDLRKAFDSLDHITLLPAEDSAIGSSQCRIEVVSTLPH